METKVIPAYATANQALSELSDVSYIVVKMPRVGTFVTYEDKSYEIRTIQLEMRPNEYNPTMTAMSCLVGLYPIDEDWEDIPGQELTVVDYSHITEMDL